MMTFLLVCVVFENAVNAKSVASNNADCHRFGRVSCVYGLYPSDWLLDQPNMSLWSCWFLS
jgi:hypothetical protein